MYLYIFVQTYLENDLLDEGEAYNCEHKASKAEQFSYIAGHMPTVKIEQEIHMGYVWLKYKGKGGKSLKFLECRISNVKRSLYISASEDESVE